VVGTCEHVDEPSGSGATEFSTFIDPLYFKPAMLSGPLCSAVNYVP
jgi:hypothetical protein